ncbi:uncharacterized protein A4U43_C10F16090 [Asparagus officinalis]|uniref:Uncharacterized protein n=3 Tax=Asparagus officinalis TaxID=4686 RepID=A0A5P1E3C4_ASPOF|nr:uncharacterized protein A4U43_C10F16090 [Asparagus officinalis]
MSGIGPEHCLSCGSYRDLGFLRRPSESAIMDIKKLKGCASLEAIRILVLDSLRSLGHLRSLRHAYSKVVAQAEDTIAEAFVRVGEFKRAMLHCKESIEIIEKLYGTNHIVIGHELLKLVSIQLSLGDRSSAVCDIERLGTIFSLYYGSHATIIFPYLGDLKREAGSSEA